MSGLDGPAVAVVLLAGAVWAGMAATLLRGRGRGRRSSGDLHDMRAQVQALYARLGRDIALIGGDGYSLAGQAAADASERCTATARLLSTADTPREYAAVRRTAVEGLVAARCARERLGLDPGPAVPLPRGTGPSLERAQRVQVGREQYDGSPAYTPGRRHYWAGGLLGGAMVPGGWYAVPFWESLLTGPALCQAYGGLGFDRGRGGFAVEQERDLPVVADERSGWFGGGGGG